MKKHHGSILIVATGLVVLIGIKIASTVDVDGSGGPNADVESLLDKSGNVGHKAIPSSSDYVETKDRFRTPQDDLELLRRLESPNRSFNDLVELMNLVKDRRYKVYATYDLYDLLDTLHLEYKKDPLRFYDIRKVRLELAKRGKEEQVEAIIADARGPSRSFAGMAIEDLSQLATDRSVETLISLWETMGDVKGEGDVLVYPVGVQAASELSKMFPRSPIGAKRHDAQSIDRAAVDEFKEWYHNNQE